MASRPTPQKKQPHPAVAPDSAAAPLTPPAETTDVSVAAPTPVAAPERRRGGGRRKFELDVPSLVAPHENAYAPRHVDLKLTARQARALKVLAHTFEVNDTRHRTPAKALAHLLDQVADQIEQTEQAAA